ncbi:hypothetical protein IA829_01055 [Listeria seeligeri]|uniref:hypothetical protein n=1 Tax=Listeria seeligeri TaxID=1640 RepID=UPI0016243AE6|nr:hypothetical protein [Listeria seeligeri]MBC2223739.1 hypothetical protein [Listeria seeligeri]MBC2229311.1 hypothetical protein [Listeria seeligeri]MBC2248237.1 hypothetical protein [Listeria seeligeri]MBF2396367.1 hypothetical protein [Listeria seeligeri]MBF2402068.1 hypothetical protein [Listeria seeligeri]
MTYNKTVPNPFLSAATYALTHIDSSQSDVVPYEVKRGTFEVDLRTSPRVPTGPISIITLASADSNYMWGVSTQAISYIDVSDNKFKEVTHYKDPAAKDIPDGTLDRVLQETFKTIDDVKNAVNVEMGMDEKDIFANIYTMVDKDNNLYSAYKRKIRVFSLVDASNPEAGIELVREVDFENDVAKGETYFAMILNMTYDGKIIVIGSQSARILDRETLEVLGKTQFGDDELITNSIAVDSDNGIYVASDKVMRKLVWTGTKLSTDESDGAWSSEYSYGDTPPSVKFGKGTGSTPTLMGFDENDDRLVVITDGVNQMNIVAFWRDEIPDYAVQVAGTTSKRIAGQHKVTCGLDPKPAFIQSEQSVVVKDYEAFVVNNVREHGDEDHLIDVFAGGPVLDPAYGCERFEWDTKTHAWKSVWTRNDVISISTVPVVSSPSNIVFTNGFYKDTGWEVTGLDWNTGETVFRTVFGFDNLGNGAYSIIQFFENGDLLFNSLGGPTRVKL